MLELVIEPVEFWDEKKEKFIYPIKKPITLQLEHSLYSLEKFEELTKKRLLELFQTKTISHEDSLLYIKCMTINKNIPDIAYNMLTSEHFNIITDYINDRHTATTIVKKNNRPPLKQQEAITSELIYYWMIQANIPFECKKWNLGRLLTLIEVCAAKQEQPEKMKPKDIMKRNHALNARNKARLKHH